jgi:hypothetical protein
MGASRLSGRGARRRSSNQEAAMGIFKREQGDVQLTSAAPSTATAAPEGQPKQQAKLTPPFVPPVKGAAAPGVVPPPAAPIYSMLPPEPAPRAEGNAQSLVAEKTKVARGAQQSVEERVRVAVQRASPATGVRRRPPARTAFDPVAATQAGLLNLAWRWQEAGAPIRAIHAYMQVLHRYPGSPGADAAVADLVELSDKLAGKGQFHIALGIYDHLEKMLACEP